MFVFLCGSHVLRNVRNEKKNIYIESPVIDAPVQIECCLLFYGSILLIIIMFFANLVQSVSQWDSIASDTALSHWSNAISMMTSSNGNIFRVINPVWGECTGHRWFPSQRSVALWYLICPEQTVEQTIETLVILDAIALIMSSL